MIDPDDPYRGEKLLLLAQIGVLAHHLCIKYPEVSEKIKERILTHVPSSKAEEEESDSRKFVQSIYRGD